MIDLVPPLRLALLSLLVLVQVSFFTIMNEASPLSWPMIGGMFALHAAVWYAIRRRPAPQSSSGADVDNPATSGSFTDSKSQSHHQNRQQSYALQSCQITSSTDYRPHNQSKCQSKSATLPVKQSKSSASTLASPLSPSSSSSQSNSIHSTKCIKKSRSQLINENFEKSFSRMQSNRSLDSSKPSKHAKLNSSAISCPGPDPKSNFDSAVLVSRRPHTDPKSRAVTKSPSFADAAKHLRCKELRERVYLWDELQSCVLVTPGVASHDQTKKSRPDSSRMSPKSKHLLFPAETTHESNGSSNHSHLTSTPRRSFDSKRSKSDKGSFSVDPWQLDPLFVKIGQDNDDHLGSLVNQSDRLNDDYHAKNRLHSHPSFDSDLQFNQTSEYLVNSELDSADLLRPLQQLQLDEAEEALETSHYDYSSGSSDSAKSGVDTSSFHLPSQQNSNCSATKSLDTIDHMITHIQRQMKQNLQLSTLSMEDSVFVAPGQIVDTNSISSFSFDEISVAAERRIHTLDILGENTVDPCHLPLTPLSPEVSISPDHSHGVSNHFVFSDAAVSSKFRFSSDQLHLANTSQAAQQTVSVSTCIHQQKFSSPNDQSSITPSPSAVTDVASDTASIAPVSTLQRHLSNASFQTESESISSDFNCSSSPEIEQLVSDLCNQIALDDQPGISCVFIFNTS